MNAKKPLDNSQKINFASFCEEETEQIFDGRIHQEINKVIDVDLLRRISIISDYA